MDHASVCVLVHAFVCFLVFLLQGGFAARGKERKREVSVESLRMRGGVMYVLDEHTSPADPEELDTRYTWEVFFFFQLMRSELLPAAVKGFQTRQGEGLV